MTIEFPLEFSVNGVPPSLNATSRTKSIWRTKVITAARAELPEGHFATEDGVSITILCFPSGEMGVDIDNTLKATIDAMRPNIYLDDRQVYRILIEKFEAGRVYEGDNPSRALAEALEAIRPIVYIRIDDDLSLGERS